MNQYNINTPNIDGLISHDFLFFEGIKVPQEIYNIKDGDYGGDNIVILEKYLNDLYNLFLRKIGDYTSRGSVLSSDSVKLQALLQEIIKVKELIEKASSTDIMDR